VTVNVDDGHRLLRLDASRDYVVKMPPQALTAPGGLVISGGHNVVLSGGHISIPWQGKPPPRSWATRRGLYLGSQTGTVHVEGLLIDGPDLAEGIDLDERDGAIVQLQNIRIVGIHARDERRFSDVHPDLVQTWAGPSELRIDHLTGTTAGQGFFLSPTDYWQGHARVFDLRHVNITGLAGSVYLLWQNGQAPLRLNDIWADPRPGRTRSQTVWPKYGRWAGVHLRRPGGGDFVPAGVAGAGYRSPGYR
jgi:hypothetical protein